MSDHIADLFGPGFGDPTVPPGQDFDKGRPRRLFDDSTNEILVGSFPCEVTPGSAPTLTLTYSMAGANTTDKVEMLCRIWSIADGESTTTESYAADNASGGVVCPDTVDERDTITITLTNYDSMLVGEDVNWELERDASDATNDTAAGDLQLHSAVITYSS